MRNLNLSAKNKFVGRHSGGGGGGGLHSNPSFILGDALPKGVD